ncbi:hypothetical protein [Streptomyces lavendulocolor]|uniref:hypothetical protein n=1 Tax=Streptomyces lavendulocolor TaxID=67316 RepID=UPI003C2FF762
MAAARASAAEAAKAAKKADAKTKEYVAQAGTDWFHADSAARDASSEAAAANNEATEAEKSAANARASADAATHDAGAAGTAATRAEQDAVAAEKSAANANQDAKAADRAEEKFRKRQEEERKAALDAPKPDTGPELTQDEEALLLAHCGESCMEEFRKAKQLLAMDVIDWVIANGGQILLDELGYTDAKKCFTQRDVESCLWTLVNVILVGAAVTKIPAVAKAIYRVSSGIHTFWEGLDKAQDTLDRLRTVLDRVKKGQSAVACLVPIVEGAAQRAASLGTTTKAGSLAAAPSARTAAAASGDKPQGLRDLSKLAQESTRPQDVQREMNALINKLMDGNDQPVKGSSGLSGGIRYLRGDKGARLFFRRVDDGWEIVGKSDKKLEPKVIAELLRIYGS